MFDIGCINKLETTYFPVNTNNANQLQNLRQKREGQREDERRMSFLGGLIYGGENPIEYLEA